MSLLNLEIPTPLRPYTNNKKKIQLEANTINNALIQLVEQFPKLKNQLYEDKNLRSYVNIYLNDEDIRYLDNKLQTKIKQGDVISIIPSIAGGSDDRSN